jgi:methionyl-tRNA formyltransferase
MHGSLLPKYRGRAPVNWAIIRGETETGATLHDMTEKPDDGDIVAQTAVPILPDDTAKEVFDKVTVAAELTLDDVLPALVAGTAPRQPQDLRQGGYFGGRKPEDGVVDWSRSAAEIHNLVRAVAPPYPGARTTLRGRPARILRTRVLDPRSPPAKTPSLTVEGNRIVARCAGGTLLILALEIEGDVVGADALARVLGGVPVPLRA